MNRKLFLKFISSYLIICLIPIFVLVLVEIISKKSLENTIIKKTLLSLEMTRDEIDSQFFQINNNSELIYNKILVSELLNKNIPANVQSYNSINLSKYMNQIVSSSELVRSTYAYSKNNDIFISDSSPYQSKDSFLQNLSNPNLLDEITKNNETGGFLQKVEYNGIEFTPYIRSFYSNSETEPNCNVIIFLNKEKIENKFGNFDLSNGGYIYIANNEIEFVTTLTKDNTYTPKLINVPKDTKIGAFSENNMIVLYTQSKYNNLSFVAVLNKNILFKSVQPLGIVINLIIFVSLLLGIIPAFFLAKGKVNSISKIVNKVSFLNNQPKDKNTYNYIKNSISDILGETKSLDTSLERQKSIVHNATINKLFYGSYDNDEEIVRQLKNLDIGFMIGKYVLIACDIGGLNYDVNNEFFEEFNIQKSVAFSTIES